MNREFFKTAILNILVFLSLILAFNIWFDKELWSGGYSSFVYSLENFLPFLSDDVYIENSDIVSESEYGMQWINVSVGSRKSTVYFGDGEFKVFKNEIDGIRTSISAAGTMTEMAEEDFVNVFKGENIALKFNTYISLTNYFGKDSSFFAGNSPVSDLVLFTTDDDDTSIRYMCFTDKNSSLSYRIPIKYNNGNLINLILKRTNRSGTSDSYAFELNFDKSADGLDRILFDSFIPITTQTKSVYKTVVIPVEYTSQRAYDAVFKAFNIKKNSARSYKDTDNVLNYIENYATLKIRENGSFVYDTDLYSKGVHIGKTNTVTDVLRFANSLYKEITESGSILVLKNSYMTENGETVYGLIYNDGNTSLYTPDGYAAEVTVKEGYISKYSQYVIKTEKTEDAFFTGSVIEAYDALYNSGLWREKVNFTISSLTPVNYYDGKEVVLKWYVEFSDGTYAFL